MQKIVWASSETTKMSQYVPITKLEIICAAIAGKHVSTLIKEYFWHSCHPVEAPAKLSEGKTAYRTADGGLRNAVLRGLPEVNTT